MPNLRYAPRNRLPPPGTPTNGRNNRSPRHNPLVPQQRATPMPRLPPQGRNQQRRSLQQRVARPLLEQPRRHLRTHTHHHIPQHPNMGRPIHRQNRRTRRIPQRKPHGLRTTNGRNPENKNKQGHTRGLKILLPPGKPSSNRTKPRGSRATHREQDLRSRQPHPKGTPRRAENRDITTYRPASER